MNKNTIIIDKYNKLKQETKELNRIRKISTNIIDVVSH